MIVGSHIERLKDKIGSGRISHVVSRSVDFGMIRMWENMADEQVSFYSRVFYAMDEARKWIVDSATKS